MHAFYCKIELIHFRLCWNHCSCLHAITCIKYLEQFLSDMIGPALYFQVVLNIDAVIMTIISTQRKTWKEKKIKRHVNWTFFILLSTQCGKCTDDVMTAAQVTIIENTSWGTFLLKMGWAQFFLELGLARAFNFWVDRAELLPYFLGRVRLGITNFRAGRIGLGKLSGRVGSGFGALSLTRPWFLIYYVTLS